MSDELAGPNLRFLVEQVTRQYQDLKVDIRVEMSTLRAEIRRESDQADKHFVSFMDESDRRFALMEEQLLAIQKFKWMALGITSATVLVVEILLNLSSLHV